MASVKTVCNLQNCRQLRNFQISVFIKIGILPYHLIIIKIYMIILDRIGHDFPLNMRKPYDFS